MTKARAHLVRANRAPFRIRRFMLAVEPELRCVSFSLIDASAHRTKKKWPQRSQAQSYCLDSRVDTGAGIILTVVIALRNHSLCAGGLAKLAATSGGRLRLGGGKTLDP
jgi:hypothetical protein